MEKWITPKMAVTVCMVLCVHGCGHYDVTLNDQLVYKPAQILQDYSISDPALRACIAQRIVDESITDATDLKQLNCASAGIFSLEGLAIFNHLQALKLSDNSIRNLVELGQMNSLQKLWLDGNNVVDSVPLAHLPSLDTLDLTGNASLQCPKNNAFPEMTTLMLPPHCLPR